MQFCQLTFAFEQVFPLMLIQWKQWKRMIEVAKVSQSFKVNQVSRQNISQFTESFQQGWKLPHSWDSLLPLWPLSMGNTPPSQWGSHLNLSWVIFSWSTTNTLAGSNLRNQSPSNFSSKLHTILIRNFRLFSLLCCIVKISPNTILLEHKPLPQG